MVMLIRVELVVSPPNQAHAILSERRICQKMKTNITSSLSLFPKENSIHNDKRAYWTVISEIETDHCEQRMKDRSGLVR